MTQTDFAQHLASTITRRRTTLDELSRRLRAMGTPVSIATLSYWQTGRAYPSRRRSVAALRNLEVLLEVPPGSFLDLLPGEETRTLWDPATIWSPEHKVLTALASIGMDLRHQAVNLTFEDVTTISADGLVSRQVCRQMVRALDERVHSIAVAFAQSGEALGPPGLEPGVGCRMENMLVLEEDHIVVGELLLPHPISRGEVAMVEYVLLHESVDMPENSMRRVLASPAHYYVAEVHFEGDYRPERAWQVRAATADPSDDEVVRTPIPVEGHLQSVVHHAERGLHGIDWYGPRTASPGLAT